MGPAVDFGFQKTFSNFYVAAVVGLGVSYCSRGLAGVPAEADTDVSAKQSNVCVTLNPNLLRLGYTW